MSERSAESPVESYEDHEPIDNVDAKSFDVDNFTRRSLDQSQRIWDSYDMANEVAEVLNWVSPQKREQIAPQLKKFLKAFIGNISPDEPKSS